MGNKLLASRLIHARAQTYLAQSQLFYYHHRLHSGRLIRAMAHRFRAHCGLIKLQEERSRIIGEQFRKAISLGNSKVVSLLLGARPAINQASTSDGSTPL